MPSYLLKEDELYLLAEDDGKLILDELLVELSISDSVTLTESVNVSISTAELPISDSLSLTESTSIAISGATQSADLSNVTNWKRGVRIY